MLSLLAKCASELCTQPPDGAAHTDRYTETAKGGELEAGGLKAGAGVRGQGAG